MFINKIYWQLTIISEPVSEFYAGKKRKLVKCRCECGKEIKSLLTSVITGHTKSCGCIQLIFKEVEKAKAMRSSWNAMKRRCNDENGRHYKYYKAKGIEICKKWEIFSLFYEDMGSTWRKGLQIDRIDNNKGYYPENCRWATAKEQQRNKTSTKLSLEKANQIRNSNLSQRELAEIYSVQQNTISRVKNKKRWN